MKNPNPFAAINSLRAAKAARKKNTGFLVVAPSGLPKAPKAAVVRPKLPSVPSMVQQKVPRTKKARPVLTMG
jgi:hypothetical protein